MKIYILIFTGVLSLTLLSCSRSEPQVLTPAPEERQYVMEVGKAGADSLLSALKPALMNAIMDGGPTHAISVCRDTAQQLTAQIGRKLGDGISIKRTTFKYRNPANAPDQFDSLALQHYQAGDRLKEPYLQKIVAGRDTSFRYYQPMYTSGLCLNCHGKTAQMEGELVRTLREAYPQDRAVGYSDNEFRGVVRVKIAGIEQSFR